MTIRRTCVKIFSANAMEEKIMKKVVYYRDYPDGSKKRYEVIIDPPTLENVFYDDYIANRNDTDRPIYFKK